MKRVLPKRERRPDGSAIWEPGHTKHRGREPGVPNKMTRLVRDAIAEAAELVGEDGKGAGGLVGYMVRLAKFEPKVFGMLLGKLLPLQIQAKILDLTPITQAMTAQEAVAAYRDTLMAHPSALLPPITIDNEPASSESEIN